MTKLHSNRNSFTGDSCGRGGGRRLSRKQLRQTIEQCLIVEDVEHSSPAILAAVARLPRIGITLAQRALLIHIAKDTKRSFWVLGYPDFGVIAIGSAAPFKADGFTIPRPRGGDFDRTRISQCGAPATHGSDASGGVYFRMIPPTGDPKREPGQLG